MSQYQDDIKAVAGLKENHGSAWNAINPEYAARMRAQNKFKTGLDIAKYTAKINGIAAKAPGLPPCHNYVNDGALIAGLVKGFNPSTYCQSPSGAFIDGTSSL